MMIDSCDDHRQAQERVDDGQHAVGLRVGNVLDPVLVRNAPDVLLFERETDVVRELRRVCAVFDVDEHAGFARADQR